MSKTKAASAVANNDIAALLTIASGAPVLSFKKRKSIAKLYEIVVLAGLLDHYKNQHVGSVVELVNPKKAKKDVAYFAGSPSSMLPSKFSHMTLRRGKGDPIEYQAWISVQFSALSWKESAMVPPVKDAGRHEIDVALFAPRAAGPYPSYEELCVGVSCKHTPTKKADIREVLGFRRESAFYRKSSTHSLAKWLVKRVPANPASPIYFASSSDNVVKKYEKPIKALGIYVVYVPFG